MRCCHQTGSVTGVRAAPLAHSDVHCVTDAFATMVQEGQVSCGWCHAGCWGMTVGSRGAGRRQQVVPGGPAPPRPPAAGGAERTRRAPTHKSPHSAHPTSKPCGCGAHQEVSPVRRPSKSLQGDDDVGLAGDGQGGSCRPAHRLFCFPLGLDFTLAAQTRGKVTLLHSQQQNGLTILHTHPVSPSNVSARHSHAVTAPDARVTAVSRAVACLNTMHSRRLPQPGGCSRGGGEDL